MQARRRTVATKAKNGASRGKAPKVPGKAVKKPTVMDNVGDMLAEQLLAIQATNADILQRLQHLETRGDPPRPVQLGPGVGEEDRRPRNPPRPEQLGPDVGRRLADPPQRRGYRPDSPGRVATLPDAPPTQEIDQTVQNFLKQLEAEDSSQFQVEGDKFVPQKFKSGQFRAGSLQKIRIVAP